MLNRSAMSAFGWPSCQLTATNDPVTCEDRLRVVANNVSVA